MTFQKGVRNPVDEYTSYQITLIRELYPIIPARHVAALIRRSVQATMKKACSLAVPGHKTTGNWRRKELQILEEGWSHLKIRTLKSKLPGRTWTAIRAKAIELKLGPRFRGRITLTQAAEIVGCYPETVRVIARVEDVEVRVKVSGRKSPRSTVEASEIIDAAKRYYSRESSKEFGKRAGMTHWGLYRFLRRIDINPEKIRKNRHFLLPEEWDALLLADQKEREHAREESGTATEPDGAGACHRPAPGEAR